MRALGIVIAMVVAMVVAIGSAVFGGCAAVAGIDDREGTRCARETHDVCEDWDNERARRDWTGPDLDWENVKGTVVPSDRSAPNALRVEFPAVEADASVEGLIGDVFGQRSADGLRISFDIRVDTLGLPDMPIGDAGGPPGATAAIAIIQWNKGGIAVALRHDGAYLFLGSRPEEARVPDFYRAILLAPASEIVGRWSHVEIACLLGAASPAVEVRFGSRPSTTPTLDPATVQLLATTEVFFGGLVVGPSSPVTFTIDNLIADFPRRD